MSRSISFSNKIRVRVIVFSLTVITVVLIADGIGMFEGINTYLYDISFKLRGVIPHNRNVIIVGIDEKTLSEMGRWPINRKYYTQLIEKLSKADAIGLNIIFTERSGEDNSLRSVIEKNGRVVTPVYIDNKYNVSESSDLIDGINGHIHLELDHDGVTRIIFNDLLFKHKIYSSFSLMLCKVARLNCNYTDHKKFKDESNTSPFVIKQTNPMRINFYGPPGIYERISLSDALKDKITPQYFKSKIVIIGVTAPGIENTVLTPFARDYGVMTSSELQANALNNLLDKNQISLVNENIRWIAIALFSFFSFIVFVRFRPKASFVFFVSSFVSILTISFLVFKYGNAWFNPAAFLISLLLMFLLGYMEKLEYASESLEKAKLEWEDAFDTLNDSIVIQDSHGIFARNNKASGILVTDYVSERLKQNFYTLRGYFQNKDQNNQLNEDVPKNELIEKDLYLPQSDTHLEIRSLPRLDKHNHFRGVVHVIRDVTERVVREEERRNLENQLIQAQKMEAIGTLAGGIAHDFNNILSAIIGYTELALYEITQQSSIRPYLEQTLWAGKRAGDLVNQILAFSRQTDAEIKPIMVASIVKETIKLLRSTLPSTIEVRQVIEESPMALGAPTQIHQIVMNLCTNAYHAMQESGGLLTVVLKRKVFHTIAELPAADMKPSEYVELTVSDTGHGIPQENLHRIFDPYYTTKKRGKGTGLGLAVVHGIVKAHYGAITVESKLGAGTTFCVFLPAIDAEEQTMFEDNETLPGGNEHILIVDDEPPLIDVERQILKRLGYSVTAQTSSKEALNLFSKAPKDYDLVITDMTMPELTGDNLAKELLNIRADIPIVLCTGFSEHISEERANALGIKEFVTKPLLIKDFARAVRRALGKEAPPPPSTSADED